MWIERVTARTFGALRDQSLELGPGLNVVFGPNEAGKTTWHAAIRMALTGVRRGRGSSTKEASALEDRHRPWDDPDRWAVEARIHLAGRRIDLVQDLLGKVACRATDLDLGVDVSAEITRPDGTPDASIWLGLDRDAFASTLAVGQGEMLAVADSADALQQHMQRAAAAHGTDATAAGAIERLREHRRRAVGADTSVAKGPLRSAMRDVAAREEELGEARRRHATYLEQHSQAEAAADALAQAERQLIVARLGAARRAAIDARRRADRAAELASRYPAPPAELAARDDVADEVAAALAAWKARPREPVAAGRRSAEIEEELRALPPPPAGDLRPADEVLAAVREVELAEEAQRALDAASTEMGAARARSTRPTSMLVAGAVFAGFAILAILLGAPAVGGLLAALALGAVAWYRFRTPRPVTEASDSAPGVVDGAQARTVAAREALADALRTHGVDPADDPLQAAARYEAACRERAEVAARATGATGLERELAAARTAERLAAEQALALAEAERALRASATAAEVPMAAEAPIETVLAGLDAWRTRRTAQAEHAQRSIREFEELTGLLGGQTVDHLAAEAVRLEEAAEALAAAAGPESGNDDGMDETAATAEVERQRARAAALAGALDVRESDLIDVPAAEEAAAAARQRLERVTELAGLIDETLGLLEAAQRQVHRDLAPLLAAAIRQWLPILSGGAYEEAGVNPADLSIEVKERATGAWRQARLLSGGTREQIYLLLRIAMAQHLVTTAEVAPMLLDEVTAQADAGRRRAILDMLLTLAAERQLILFTHDEAVLAWAENHLTADPHRILRLPLASAPAPNNEPVAVPVGSGT
ncbi:MAG TPA: AAA family ATPase [Candidatus Limnocylindria bacterium]|nr:AAA family ATPase [Candidatus Limnocylindria bacterium]